MNRILGRIASILGVALVAGMAAPACSTSDESESIFIRGVLAPPTTRTNGQCTYSNDPSQTMLFYGKFDVGLSGAYNAVMLVGNQLLAKGDQNSSRAESNRLNVESVEVEVKDSAGNLVGAFRAPTNGVIDPQSSNSPSFTPIGAVIIDAKVSSALRDKIPLRGEPQTVIANVRAKASTFAGTEVKSGTFSFPIRVCNGCLVDFSAAYDQATKTYDCKKELLLGTGTVLPCTTGQDEGIPCQFCQGLDACSP